MLSRIAESLFWIGRYVERAEDTARILDVHVHHLLEDPWVVEDAACRTLLGVMGFDPVPDVEIDVGMVTSVLAFDAESPSSIVGALVAARENARGARDAISTEMWECLNTTYNALPAEVAAVSGRGLHPFFQYVRERSAVLAGLAATTMSQDDGWRFLTLGRSLERVDMTARLLSARLDDATASPEWVTTLRCCSAHEAYLRTYHRAVDGSLAAEFLLLDRLFPRSVYHALSTAETMLAELDPRPQGSRLGVEDEARLILGRARTNLEYRRLPPSLRDLRGDLEDLQVACSEAGSAVAHRYFRQTAPLSWAV